MADELIQILDFIYCSRCPYRFSCTLNPAYCPDIDDMKEEDNGSGEE